MSLRQSVTKSDTFFSPQATTCNNEETALFVSNENYSNEISHKFKTLKKGFNQKYPLSNPAPNTKTDKISEKSNEVLSNKVSSQECNEDTENNTSDSESGNEDILDEIIYEENAKLLEIDLVDFPVKIYTDFERQSLSITKALADSFVSLIPNFDEESTGDKTEQIETLFNFYMALLKDADNHDLSNSKKNSTEQLKSDVTPVSVKNCKETYTEAIKENFSIESSPLEAARFSVFQTATLSTVLPQNKSNAA